MEDKLQSYRNDSVTFNEQSKSNSQQQKMELDSLKSQVERLKVVVTILQNKEHTEVRSMWINIEASPPDMERSNHNESNDKRVRQREEMLHSNENEIRHPIIDERERVFDMRSQWSHEEDMPDYQRYRPNDWKSQFISQLL